MWSGKRAKPGRARAREGSARKFSLQAIHWAQRIKNCNNTTTNPLYTSCTLSTLRATTLHLLSFSLYTETNSEKPRAQSIAMSEESNRDLYAQHHFLPGTRATTTNTISQVAHVARAAKHKADVCRQGMRFIAIPLQSNQAAMI